jgi:hypothetical protein
MEVVVVSKSPLEERINNIVEAEIHQALNNSPPTPSEPEMRALIITFTEDAVLKCRDPVNAVLPPGQIDICIFPALGTPSF